MRFVPIIFLPFLNLFWLYLNLLRPPAPKASIKIIGTYLLVLIDIWSGDWKKLLARTKKRLGEENGLLTRKISIRKVHRFSRNGFYKNIDYIILMLALGAGGG